MWQRLFFLTVNIMNTKGNQKPKKQDEGLARLELRFGKERVEDWKRHFAPRRVIVIEVEDKMCVLRPVTANALSQYATIFRDGGLEPASRYLLEELWLDGDDDIRNNEEYFIGSMLQIQNAIELKKSTCWKL